jgi:hypothetical protein
MPPGHQYEGASKRFRFASIAKYMLTTINTRWEATQSLMTAKLTRLTHKIAIQLYLVADSCTIWSSRSRWPVWKLLDSPSYVWRSGGVALCIIYLCTRWIRSQVDVSGEEADLDIQKAVWRCWRREKYLLLPGLEPGRPTQIKGRRFGCSCGPVLN